MPTRIYQILEMNYYCHALEALQMKQRKVQKSENAKILCIVCRTNCACPHTCLVKPKIIHACLLSYFRAIIKL